MLKHTPRTNASHLSAQHQRIRELCAVLAETALQLDHQRRSSPRESIRVGSSAPRLESFWGSAAPQCNDDASPQRLFWYHAIEPAFEELEQLVRVAPPPLCEAVLADPTIATKLPMLHQVRAAYEYDKEMVLAQAIVEASAGSSYLTRLLEQEAFWAFSPELRRALHGCRRIVVAGSGPLPLTALSIAQVLGVSVTTVECDETAFDVGRNVIALAGCSDHINCILAYIEDLENLDRFDAVVGAVLLGVDMGADRRHHRAALAQQVIRALLPGAKLIVREPHGLGQLFHPHLDLQTGDRFEAEMMLPRRSLSTPYRSGIAVLRRTEETIT